MWKAWAKTWTACVLLAAGGAQAADWSNRPPIAPSVPREPNEWIDALDRYHDAASSYVVGFGEGMDGWLSRRFRSAPGVPFKTHSALNYDPEQLREADGSRVVISPAVEVQEGDGASFGLKFNGRLKLPRFSERLELIFDSDYDDTAISPEIARPDDIGLRPGDQGAASLRYRLSDDFKFKPSLEAGLKFKPEPVPRLGLRLRLTTRRTFITSRLTQIFFWETQDGWGERTTFDLERGKRDRYLCRLSTSALWSEGSDGLQGGETLQLYRYLSSRRAVGAKLGVFGPLEPSAHVETYSARLVWRQRLHRDWLFLEIEPGVDWPRDRDYAGTMVMRIKLDIVFGDWFENTNGNGK